MRFFKRTSKKISRATRRAGKSFNRSAKRAERSLNRFDRKLTKSVNKAIARRERKRAKAFAKANRKYEIKETLKKGADIHQFTYSPAVYGIVNAKRRAMGKSPLRGQELYEAVKSEATRRASSVNFLRSGWLASIAEFAKKIGKAAKRDASKLGSRLKYGGATTARPSNSPSTEFWNFAASRHTTTNDGKAIAEQGLKLAVVQTTQRMAEYIAKKQEARGATAMKRFLR